MLFTCFGPHVASIKESTTVTTRMSFTSTLGQDPPVVSPQASMAWGRNRPAARRWVPTVAAGGGDAKHAAANIETLKIKQNMEMQVAEVEMKYK